MRNCAPLFLSLALGLCCSVNIAKVRFATWKWCADTSRGAIFADSIYRARKNTAKLLAAEFSIGLFIVIISK